MEYLKCYTVKDHDIEEGIYVPEFESIIVETPSTTTIKKATIEMIPVLKTRGGTSITETSLVFLHEAGKSDKESKDHIIIAIDPNKWKLCYKTNKLAILDPCGFHGHMLLVVDKSMEQILIKADDRKLSLQFSNNKLTIAGCQRSALLRSAITRQLSAADARMSSSEYRTTDPTSE